MPHLFRLLAIGAFGTMFACSDPAPAQKPAEPDVIQLPVSLNEVMVALVNQAADPLWVAAWKTPATEAEWRELERRAYQLQIAGTLIEYPGTGPYDHQWAAKPSWIRWSRELHDVGASAIKAVEDRDLAAIAGIGDRTVEICEGCHTDFKLDMPTRGKFGELSPTPSTP